MKEPSQKLLKDIQSSRKLFLQIIAHSTELEPVLSRLGSTARGDTKEAIKQVLGTDLSIAFLYYGHDADADIEAKAYCSELNPIGDLDNWQSTSFQSETKPVSLSQHLGFSCRSQLSEFLRVRAHAESIRSRAGVVYRRTWPR